jgi:hypothetical protein
MSFFHRISSWFKSDLSAPISVPEVVIVPTETKSGDVTSAQTSLLQTAVQPTVVPPQDAQVTSGDTVDSASQLAKDASTVPPLLDLEDTVNVSIAVSNTNTNA